MSTNPYSLPNDGQFRRGAQHAAFWLKQRAQKLANEGKSVQDIVNHLNDLEDVIGDWREGKIKDIGGVTGNPWNWPKDQLEEYITKNRKYWSGDESDE
jgi:hypothetical protein